MCTAAAAACFPVLLLTIQCAALQDSRKELLNLRAQFNQRQTEALLNAAAAIGAEFTAEVKNLKGDLQSVKADTHSLKTDIKDLTRVVETNQIKQETQMQLLANNLSDRVNMFILIISLLLIGFIVPLDQGLLGKLLARFLSF